MYDNLQLELREGVARVTLNRPDKLNALSFALMEELLGVVRDLKGREDMRVLLVKGSGRAFSAGVDLKETDPADFGNDTGILKLGYDLCKELETLPLVTIAQVHGYCFTGALELALMFDLLYCTNDTQFGDTHAKWAIMPRWGMTQRLARRIGLARAKEMTFRANRVRGDEAEKIGLVNRSFSSEAIETEIDGIIGDILSNDREAIHRIKSLYNDGYATTLSHGLQLELDADPRLSSTADILRQFEQKKKQ